MNEFTLFVPYCLWKEAKFLPFELALNLSNQQLNRKGAFSA
jgi:hypothetical protein